MNEYIYKMTWVIPRNACTSLELAPVDIVVYFRSHSQLKKDSLVHLGCFNLCLYFLVNLVHKEGNGHYLPENKCQFWSYIAWFQILPLSFTLLVVLCLLHIFSVPWFFFSVQQNSCVISFLVCQRTGCNPMIRLPILSMLHWKVPKLLTGLILLYSINLPFFFLTT